MNKVLLSLATLTLSVTLLSTNSVTAQCTPAILGNSNTSGQWFINWRSAMIINETDTWTNTASMPRYVDITDFEFHLGRTGNPITPFIVQRNFDNNFTVLAVGETRTTADYSVGSNSFPFASTPTRILVAPGATIATGFLEANPNGSGVASFSMVTLDTNGDEIWFTGGPGTNHSGSVTVGQAPMVGQWSFTGITWSYKFNISICPEDISSYSGGIAGGVFYNVNTTNDGDDINPGDGICANAAGLCSFRAAVQEGNAGSDPMNILFSASGGLQIDSQLPDINQSVFIDGFSAPDYAFALPTIQLRGAGFNMITIRNAQTATVRGMNLSSLSTGGFDSFGLSVYASRDVNIHDNVIRNRTRAIHANGVYDLTIIDNDLRDCGDDFRDGAVFLRHVLEDNLPGGMKVRSNLYGGVNTSPQSLFQVHYCRDVVISDGTVPNTNIEVTDQESFWYPIRFYKTINATVSNLDLSGGSMGMNGIGIRALESQDISVLNCKIAFRRTALDIDGGSRILVNNCDFSDSGLNTDQGTVTIRNFSVNDPGDLSIAETVFAEVDMQVDNYVSLFSSNGISITGLAQAGNIQFDGVLNNYYPISMNLCDDITVRGLQFSYSSPSYHQAKAIWMENGCSNVRITENRFEGWAAAIHSESATNSQLECNMLTGNRNGVLIDNNSTFSSIANNNFGCNAIAIHQRGSQQIVTNDNWWGDETGSSSAGGTGDWMIGNVDVSAFSIAQNTCAEIISVAACAGEICNNGIDDDMDGLVDCDDGGCANDPDCMGPIVNRGPQGASMEKSSMEIQKVPMVTVYPNPSHGQFSLRCSLPCNSYLVYDVLGNEIMSGRLDGVTEMAIDLSGMENGSYLVQVSSNDRIEVVRLIKN